MQKKHNIYLLISCKILSLFRNSKIKLACIKMQEFQLKIPAQMSIFLDLEVKCWIAFSSWVSLSEVAPSWTILIMLSSVFWLMDDLSGVQMLFIKENTLSTQAVDVGIKHESNTKYDITGNVWCNTGSSVNLVSRNCGSDISCAVALCLQKHKIIMIRKTVGVRYHRGADFFY